MSARFTKRTVSPSLWRLPQTACLGAVSTNKQGRSLWHVIRLRIKQNKNAVTAFFSFWFRI